MVKVAPEAPSSSTGTCFVLARSCENNWFFFAGAAPWALAAASSVGRAAVAALSVSLRAAKASLVSPATIRTLLLPGIFMRLQAGWVAAMN